MNKEAVPLEEKKATQPAENEELETKEAPRQAEEETKKAEEAASIIQVETETLPIRENQKAYQDAYSLYCELYGALKPVYDKGAALAL